MCPNLKYKKVVAINPKKIIFRALKKNFIKNFAVRFFLQRKQYLILNTTVLVLYNCTVPRDPEYRYILVNGSLPVIVLLLMAV